jgi:hypothetical protein
MIRKGFRQPKKADIKKHNQKYEKALKDSIGKEHILLVEGITAWYMDITNKYMQLDVGFSEGIMKLFNEITKQGNKLLELTKSEIDMLPLEYASFVTKNKLKEFALKSVDKLQGNKYTADELGILERDYLYFQQLDIMYDVLNDELCRDKRYTDKQVEKLKLMRRYCKKIVAFFNKEVESDMKNRGLAV